MNPPALRRSDFLWATALSLVTLLLYSPVRQFTFMGFDDDGYVTANRHVRAGLTADSVRWAFATGEQSNWHPLTWLSLQADVSLFGVNPAAMHLHNVALHALAAATLLLALIKLTGELNPSLATAALFAWHPLHVESVAWISERKDVLAGLMMMLCLLTYAFYAARPRWGTYLLLCVLLALGLMAKPMLVTLPAVLILLDYLAAAARSSQPPAADAAVFPRHADGADRRKISAAVTCHHQLSDHVSCSERRTQCRYAQFYSSFCTARQRADQLRHVPVQDNLADESGDFLSALRDISGRPAQCRGAGRERRDHSRDQFLQLAAAATCAMDSRRLALVPRNARAGDRLRAGGSAGVGGSVFVHAADRRVYRDQLDDLSTVAPSRHRPSTLRKPVECQHHYGRTATSILGATPKR